MASTAIEPGTRIDLASSSGGERDRVLAHLNARGFIQFHPGLADLLGFKAAIFLGHALYWSQHLARHEPQRRGWFFMTARQWQDATGLTTREQTALRSELVARGLVQEALAGHPAKLHYKIDLSAVVRLLNVAINGPLSWEVLTPLMRDSVRFYKPLADLTASVAAGLYLSHMLQMARQSAQNAASPFLVQDEFVTRPEVVRTTLGLGPKTQRNALDQLMAAGLLQCGRAKQASQTIRLNYAAIIACIESQPSADRRLSNRRSASKPTAISQGLVTLSLVPAPGPAPASACLQRPCSTAPLDHAGRQLTLFGVTGLMPLRHPSARPSTPLATMVRSMGLFSGRQAAAKPATDAKPFAATEPPGSAADQASEGQFALLSKLGQPICRFVEPNLPFCRNIQGIQQGINTTTTAQDSRPVDKSVAHGTPRRGRGRGQDESQSQEPPTQAIATLVSPIPAAVDLVMPHGLDAQWLPAVLRTLDTVPVDTRQTLLDELAGQLATPGKVIHNPPAWLLALSRRLAQGSAVLALADKVRGDRQARQRHQQAYNRALAGQEPGAAPTPTPTPAPSPSPIHAQAAPSPESAGVRDRRVQQLRQLKERLSGGGS